MKYRYLGTSDLRVSELCLGSMSWGSQNTEVEGHRQIDIALDAGVNFIDTAELYPTNPVRPETVGNTETIIGNWFARTGRRKDVILASKIAGHGNPNVRGGEPITAKTLREVLDLALNRLQTDYIDLYQFHWPNRGSYSFRQNWRYDASKQDREAVAENMAEVVTELAAQRQAGKIRHFGLSNETAWGTMAWIRAAETAQAPRVVSVQNEYSLMCRLYDTDMAEMSQHEQVGLLAFSPVAAGLLSGKYRADLTPPLSRRSVTPDLGGRIAPRIWDTLEAYRNLANTHGIALPQLALAFVLSRPFLGSAIFGATSEPMLRGALASAEITLSPEILGAIDRIHKEHPMPF
jgi:aryl-alcohol dehydrogenase-like predicted oxidoreductase